MQRRDEFQEDVSRSKRLLEDVSGTAVRGYRAASWSLDARSPWAYAVLAEAGFAYSSSVYPIAHDHYGTPDAPATPFYVRSAEILEIPATTVRLSGRNWPASGGGYFRLLPLPVSLWLLRRARRTRKAPAMFYFHPWELDPAQPRIREADRRSKFRHYLNLHKFESRLEVLLRSFRWGRMDELYLSGTEAVVSREHPRKMPA
jgi:polysaccharide deacetylase family protein (PEP-CTERM system associated)